MAVRVYVGVAPGELVRLLDAPALPAGLAAYAVTDGLRAAVGEDDEELCEYAALHLAADASWAARGAGDPARRAVLVAEVGRVEETGDDPGGVRLLDDVAWRRVVALHADTEPVHGDPTHDDAAPELGWFATQEIAEVVAGW